MAQASGPADFDALDAPADQDRWQAQVLGRVLRHADVWLHTDGLDDDEVRASFLRPVPDVGEAVARARDASGGDGRVCVLPYGPLTVATAQ
jgi:hypothetical protein